MVAGEHCQAVSDVDDWGAEWNISVGSADRSRVCGPPHCAFLSQFVMPAIKTRLAGLDPDRRLLSENQTAKRTDSRPRPSCNHPTRTAHAAFSRITRRLGFHRPARFNLCPQFGSHRPFFPARAAVAPLLFQPTRHSPLFSLGSLTTARTCLPLRTAHHPKSVSANLCDLSSTTNVIFRWLLLGTGLFTGYVRIFPSSTVLPHSDKSSHGCTGAMSAGDASGQGSHCSSSSNVRLICRRWTSLTPECVGAWHAPGEPMKRSNPHRVTQLRIKWSPLFRAKEGFTGVSSPRRDQACIYLHAECRLAQFYNLHGQPAFRQCSYWFIGQCDHWRGFIQATQEAKAQALLAHMRDRFATVPFSHRCA